MPPSHEIVATGKNQDGGEVPGGTDCDSRFPCTWSHAQDDPMIPGSDEGEGETLMFTQLSHWLSSADDLLHVLDQIKSKLFAVFADSFGFVHRFCAHPCKLMSKGDGLVDEV